MVENDSLIYQIKRSPVQQVKPAEISLISQERTQKLDLLMHLLTNLSQPLVVCGPEGIGKTTLLHALQARQVNSWTYCFVQGNSELSFESILRQVAKALDVDPQKSEQKLLSVLNQYENQQKKIILMVDDAGDLVAGLIATLIQFASAHSVLRVILVLTHDDLFVKNTTDRAVEDCHFIEIPPLSEKHCGDFLKHLAAMPFPQISQAAITDSLVERIYLETHGLPGKIIDDLPKINKAKTRFSATSWLVLALSILIAVALALQWYSGSRFNVASKSVANTSTKTSKIAQPQLPIAKAPEMLPNPALEKQAEVDPAQVQKNISNLQSSGSTAAVLAPEPESQPAKPTQTGSDAGSVSTKNETPLTQKIENPTQSPSVGDATPKQPELPSVSGNIVGGVTSQTPAAEVVVPDTKMPTDETQEGSNWILSQPDANLTLQVMVLTKADAVQELLAKYKALEFPLNYFKTISPSGREKYQIVFGSFTSPQQANKARQSLPVELRKAYSRSFSSIKAEIATSR